MPDKIQQTIYSPIPSGSGATIVHRCLEKHLDNYQLRPIDPKLTLIPPLLSIYKNRDKSTIHSSIELISYVSHPEQYSVATIHNYYLDNDYVRRCNPVHQLYYKTMLRHQFLSGLKRANKIVTVSKATRDLVLNDLQPVKSVREKIITIANGVDCQHFHPGAGEKDTTRFNILFSGNPTSRKGWPMVVSIADQLPSHLRIFCTTGIRDIKNLPKKKNIIYLPNVPYEKMPEVYQQVDALLLPSYREGLSLALLEAMACGLPIIAFNVSSMPEAVEHQKGGFLVEQGKAEQLLKAIQKLTVNPTLRQEYGAYNRERCLRDFNLYRMVDEYQQVFRMPPGIR